MDIIESSNIPENEKVYLKKDFLGWRVVEPVIDPETKRIVWRNVFSKKGIAFLIFILVVIGFGYLAYQEQITNFNTVMENPCQFCEDCQDYARDYLQQNIPRSKIDSTINWTIIS